MATAATFTFGILAGAGIVSALILIGSKTGICSITLSAATDKSNTSAQDEKHVPTENNKANTETQTTPSGMSDNAEDGVLVSRDTIRALKCNACQLLNYSNEIKVLIKTKGPQGSKDHYHVENLAINDNNQFYEPDSPAQYAAIQNVLDLLANQSIQDSQKFELLSQTQVNEKLNATIQSEDYMSAQQTAKDAKMLEDTLSAINNIVIL